MSVFFAICVAPALLGLSPPSVRDAPTVKISGQSLIYMRAGGLHGCGLRLIGELSPDTSSDTEIFDVSVNIYVASRAVAKFVSFNTTEAELRVSRPVRKFQLENGWVRAPGATATLPLDGNIARSKDNYSILYATSVDSALAIFRAAEEMGVVNIGIRRAGGDAERLFAGEVLMSDEDRDEIRTCVLDLAK